MHHFFDINQVFLNIYDSLKNLREEHGVDVFFDVTKGLPREFRGDSKNIELILMKMLIFAIENTRNKGVHLTVDAPDDFFYKEHILFEIKDSRISKEKINSFMKLKLKDDIDVLNGSIFRENSDISFSIKISFQVHKLGNRRHYRLPNSYMLNQNILLIMSSKERANSTKEKLGYFSYDTFIEKSTKDLSQSDLMAYDIVIVEDSLVTDKFEIIIKEMQQNMKFKYIVVLTSDDESSRHCSNSTKVENTITQMGIFDLLVLTLDNEITDDDKISEKLEKYYLQDSIDDDLEPMLKDISEDMIFNFIKKYDNSHSYFHTISVERDVLKLKEFCVELKYEAEQIGAANMIEFSDNLFSVLNENKLNLLPIYSSRFYIELSKLMVEIREYL